MTAQGKNGDELAYALITPYSLHKSRTGGILARLLWADVRLVAARMYAPRPDNRFIEEYCDAIYDPEQRRVPLRYQRMLIEYVIRNFGKPNVHNISNRLVVLVFRGPNARRDVLEAVGRISEPVRGDNVRGTFGDNVLDRSSDLDYRPAFLTLKRLQTRYAALREVDMPDYRSGFFEPGVLSGPTPEMLDAHLKVFRKYAYSDGGFVLDALEGMDGPEIETSMVILKPESFRHRNPLPGNLIDFFARTGMCITAAKVVEMTVQQAREFYGQKVPQFRRQLKGMVAERARQIVERAHALGERVAQSYGVGPEAALGPAHALALAEAAEELYASQAEPGEVKPEVVGRIFDELRRRLTDLTPPDSLYEELAEDLKDLNARTEFNSLITYMTGRDPESGLPLREGESTRCMALLYAGRSALSVIRQRLKELRQVYGKNVLVNRAHASDPEEDPEKEIEVLGMPTATRAESRPCDLEEVVNEFYGPE